MSARQQITVHPVATGKADSMRVLSQPPPWRTHGMSQARGRAEHIALMSPVEFMALVAGWGAGLVLLLFISAVVRYLI